MTAAKRPPVWHREKRCKSVLDHPVVGWIGARDVDKVRTEGDCFEGKSLLQLFLILIFVRVAENESFVGIWITNWRKNIYRRNTHGSMMKRFEKRDFSNILKYQASDSNSKKKFSDSIRCPSSAESRNPRSQTRVCLRSSHFQASLSPLTERSCCQQQRARGCTRGGCRARVSSPRAGTRDARESRSTRWPRRDESTRRVPWVERVAFGWLANGSGKSRGRTPEGSRRVTPRAGQHGVAAPRLTSFRPEGALLQSDVQFLEWEPTAWRRERRNAVACVGRTEREFSGESTLSEFTAGRNETGP